MYVPDDLVKLLFQSFRDHDDGVFYRTAETIISRELASNHHSSASDLKKSLGQKTNVPQNNLQIAKLTSLPKDRRHGEELISLQESKIDHSKIVLSKETEPKIQRLLVEHQKRTQLAKFGFSPKNKLLFWGPPGCGKTFTAYYLAYELGLPVGVIRLNAIISSFLGDTTSHLQRVFDLANEKPMVLLLDEVDAVGKNRDDSNDVGELKRVVNGLLQAMDFFNSTRSIIIAASNHQYLLDPALWRRFDDIIQFPIPSISEKESYLSILLNGIHYSKTILSAVKKMDSFSFADIEKVTTESLKTMILSGRKNLTKADLMEQIDIYHKNFLATKNSESR